MTEDFKIYIDRLKGGQVHLIEKKFDPSFLEVNEKELQFEQPITVSGEAYLTDDHLVIHLSALTMAKMPCSMCNQMIPTPLIVDNLYHAEPLVDIPNAIYDFQVMLREALLLELPQRVECNSGNCPSRTIIKPYLRSEKRSDTHFPFADIDLKE